MDSVHNTLYNTHLHIHIHTYILSGNLELHQSLSMTVNYQGQWSECFDVLFPTLSPLYGLVRMWELDYKESWAQKNWCFWTVVLEKTLESLLDCKGTQPVHPKGDQSWVFIGRTDVEAETPILWPPDAKSWLIEKDPDAGKDWGQEEKGMTEDERVGWHHRRWTWVWVDSGIWWWTGRPGVLWFMGSQRVGDDWATELNWTELAPHGKLFINTMIWLTKSGSILQTFKKYLV